MAGNPARKQRFLQERSALPRGCGIPTSSRSCTVLAGESAYIVMEFVAGETLAEIVRRRSGPLPGARGRRVRPPRGARTGLRGTARRRTSRHQAAEPDSDPQSRLVKILDFGLGRLVDEHRTVRLTREGDILGDGRLLVARAGSGLPRGRHSLGRLRSGVRVLLSLDRFPAVSRPESPGSAEEAQRGVLPRLAGHGGSTFHRRSPGWWSGCWRRTRHAATITSGDRGDFGPGRAGWERGTVGRELSGRPTARSIACRAHSDPVVAVGRPSGLDAFGLLVVVSLAEVACGFCGGSKVHD